MLPDSGYADEARHQAQQILSQPPYTTTPSSSPHPLAGVLHAIGHAFDVVFGPVGRWLENHLFRAVGSGLTSVFGTWTLAVVIAMAVLVGVVVAVLLVRRRARIASRSVEARVSGATADPSAMEVEADRLAGQGDFAAALRLRFRAGLLRLEAAGLVAHQEIRTDSQMATLLGSPTFDRLAERHQAVTYAGLPADAEDERSARAGWPAVAPEVRRHRATVDAGAT